MVCDSELCLETAVDKIITAVQELNLLNKHAIG